MSDDEQKAAVLPTWAMYAILAVSGLGGVSGVGTAGYQWLAPPTVQSEVRQLKVDVAAVTQTVTQLNAALGASLNADAARDLLHQDHDRRIEELEDQAAAVRAELYTIKVNQLVICRTLKAPCGG